MKKIIRLTESDLTRIVRRVISEDAKKIGNAFTVDGDTYQAQVGQGPSGPMVFYWGSKSQLKALGSTVDKLNKLSGYNIPSASGTIYVGYIQKNPGFKTTLRGLV
jgi:hypothetical protein